jgi:hypothetical protein
MRVSTRPRSSMGLGTRPWRDLHCCLGVVPLLAKRLGKVTATTIGGYVARPHASEKFASLADVSFIVAPPCDFALGRVATPIRGCRTSPGIMPSRRFGTGTQHEVARSADQDRSSALAPFQI